MAKMSIEIPIVAATLLFRQDYFDTISDSLNVRHTRYRGVLLLGRLVVGGFPCRWSPVVHSFVSAFNKNVSGGREAGQIGSKAALSPPIGALDVNVAAWTLQNKCKKRISSLRNSP